MKRRDFLRTMGGLAVGAAMPRLWWPLASPVSAAPGPLSNRILVMVVLEGGNDGLNTVVPVSDPLYYSMRPDIAVPANQALTLQPGAGFHPGLAPIMNLWNEGNLAVVRDVSYPDANLSHFRATDILLSASGSQEVLSTGWLGRWLEVLHPDFPGVLPPDPLGLQQGLSAGLLFQGDRGSTGVVVYDPSSFYWLVNSNWTGITGDAPPATRGGEELAFLREVDRASFEYAGSIQAAADNGANAVAYPASYLGEQLAVTARLIDGGMNTPVYVTSHSGFDTHANQLGDHPGLLTELAEALSAFSADMKAIGRWDDVLVLTVSEFGRRPEQNGSLGCDHGTAAPWLMMGGSVVGGILGQGPDLASLDANGNLAMQHDFRSVYASVLQGWFETPGATVEAILGAGYPVLPIVNGATAPGIPGTTPERPSPLRLEVLGADRGASSRRVSFSLPAAGPVSLGVFDVRGRRIALLLDGWRAAGGHELDLSGLRAGSGVYFLKLSARGETATTKLVLR